MRPLGFREAAEFWGVAADPELAFRLHALTGGTPEYKDLCGGVGPRSLADFDDWVRLRLLDPAGPMFREGGPVPSEGTASTDPASYASVLGAISAGAARPAEIAAAHFASLARQWCLRHAAEATLGGVARAARPTAIACREHRQEHPLEAVFVEDRVAAGRVIAIGEMNAASGPMEARPLRRLEHLCALLPSGSGSRPDSSCSVRPASPLTSQQKRPLAPTSSSSASIASTGGLTKSAARQRLDRIYEGVRRRGAATGQGAGSRRHGSI